MGQIKMSEWDKYKDIIDWTIYKNEHCDYKLYDKMTDTFIIFEYPDDLEQLREIFIEMSHVIDLEMINYKLEEDTGDDILQ